MGHPVVHFEVVGKDGPGLQRFFADLFGWEIDADNPLGYGAVSRGGNSGKNGAGIGGGIGAAPGGGDGHVTFYVEVRDVGAALAKAEELGGKAVFGPGEVPGMGIVLGQFTDPEGHVIGLRER